MLRDSIRLRDRIRRWLPAVLQTVITVGLVLLLWLPFLPLLQSSPVQQVSYSELLQAIRDGRVQAVQISPERYAPCFARTRPAKDEMSRHTLCPPPGRPIYTT